MRSPALMDIIVLDITNRCFLNCSNCTRLIAHQSHTEEMTPDQLRAALRSLQGWDSPGKVVGLIGGEPTLHSRFKELCHVFREEWRPGRDCTHGRDPITDYDKFAAARLWDRSNGRGLWTSFGPRFREHAEVIMDTFSHWNPNDHSAGGHHQALLIHRDDYCRETGTSAATWELNRDKCWVQNLWSATINPHGAYFCEVAASIDRTLYGGKSAWPVEADWWKREPPFTDQRHLCDHCSLAQKGPSSVDSADRDIVSDTNRIALQLVGSPAVKGGRFDAYGPAHLEENRSVDTKDNYTAGPRVAADNPHVKPQKLSAVVVCVWRARHLLHTLLHNAKLVDELIVVTDPNDMDTMGVVAECRKRQANVRAVFSVRAYEREFAFNKGALLNDGLRSLDAGADWVILTDADVFLNPETRSYVMSHALNPGVLYGTNRYDVGEAHAAEYVNGKPVQGWPSAVGVNAEPNGYFQLFNRRASSIRWPVALSEEFCSAGGVDSWFLQQFPKGKRVQIPELSVVHINHAGNFGDGWNGTERSGWRQVGMLTAAGFHWIVPAQPLQRLRLTDTLHGDSWEGDSNGAGLPKDVLHVNGQGLVFKGRPIGFHHIHVAAWIAPTPPLPGTVSFEIESGEPAIANSQPPA